MAAPSAQAALITYFNFEDGNLLSDAAVPLPQQQTTMTTNFSAVLNGYSFPATMGAALNRAPGDNLLLPNAPMRLDTNQGANNTNWIQFSVNTTTLAGLSLSYATRNNNGLGFTTQTLSYSINGGTSFVPVGTFSPNQSNIFQLASYDLSAITAVNNQTSVIFRITFDGAGNGNNQFTDIDNLQLNAAAVPEPGTWIGAALALSSLGFMQRRRLRGLIARRT